MRLLMAFQRAGATGTLVDPTPGPHRAIHPSTRLGTIHRQHHHHITVVTALLPAKEVIVFTFPHHQEAVVYPHSSRALLIDRPVPGIVHCVPSVLGPMRRNPIPATCTVGTGTRYWARSWDWKCIYFSFVCFAFHNILIFCLSLSLLSFWIAGCCRLLSDYFNLDGAWVGIELVAGIDYFYFSFYFFFS